MDPTERWARTNLPGCPRGCKQRASLLGPAGPGIFAPSGLADVLNGRGGGSMNRRTCVPAKMLSAVSLGIVLSATPQEPALGQGPATPVVTETVIRLDGGTEMRYAISVPADAEDSRSDPRPLVLALHPGGRYEYYGSSFMQTVVEPALRGWGAVIVAPDVPDRSWATSRSERAVLALLDEIRATHSIDETRVLVTGFSAGGRGAWFLASRNPEIFTGAIVMASSPEGALLDDLAETPLIIIHSPDDQVVPYGPVEEVALELGERGYPVHMMRLPGASHYDMRGYVLPLRAAGDWMMEQWTTRSEADE